MIANTPASSLLDVNARLVHGLGDLAIHREQEIPDYHLAALRDLKSSSAASRAGEMHQVCSIPVALVEHWQRQGFDVFKEPAAAILARLRREDMTDFITTTKM